MVEVRRVKEEEMQAVMELAEDVFFLEQGIPREMCYIGPEQEPLWWGAFEGEWLVGTAVSYVEDSRRHMGRITVRPQLRGQRIGSAVIEQALRDLFRMGVPEVFLDARPTTVNIILRLWGRVIGAEYEFFKGTCTPIAITKEEFLKKNTI